jgi:integrase
VDREITLLRGVFRLARREWQWMTGDPWVDVSRPKQPPPRDRRISEEEIQAILTACGYCEGARPDDRYQETAVLFLLAIETAMRAGELVGLAWDRVDLDRRVATLEQTKNGTGRRVPLSSRAVELLRSLEGLHPVRCVAISSSVLDATFRRARWRAGIEGLTFHDTRHEAITRLARRLDLLDLARMVGHRDPRSLMIYYNATAEELAGRLG